ncbi:hypothetical protein [Amycolatopsis jejuensis]|uniref:hypothetical protein n=1 Tax=Amycolatopsis jejuensis TaxID=330084 RepID=UPI0005252DF2|nr:hypothetical protein [Amycolatopsis jejuensis]
MSDVGFGKQQATAGSAGQDFLSGIVNPFDDAGAQKLNQGAQRLKKLAQNGGFAINEEGFRAYLAVCDEFIKNHSDSNSDLFYLGTRAKMGSSDYAKRVADFNVSVAAGGPDSLTPNLNLLKTSFEQVKEALEIARKNYRETEDTHTQTFAKGFGSGE